MTTFYRLQRIERLRIPMTISNENMPKITRRAMRAAQQKK